eukprot:TRINITY_DN11613_c0_g2_i1.p1 TRINITY_DN11613_c0_g2~~TRINITY_DN11613_c0_g2_i1.p1  ORF type:complete len:517 (+),score=52.16 TRINITY_DN11613_c0_g2_i1:211-1551(+)
MEEGFLPAKNDYTRAELRLNVIRGGVSEEDADRIIAANFDHNPSGKQDIFNMEGAQNEHATSTGITDCFSTFTRCREANGVPVCVSATPDPNCGNPSMKRFDEFVAAVDTNNDNFITPEELASAEKNGQFPIIDHNPHGLGSLYVSIFVTIKLFGEEDGSGIKVQDFKRIMVDRTFTGPALSSGYFWGRPIEPVIPAAAELLDGADATCTPGTRVLGADNCNTCECPALGVRSLARRCTRSLCVTASPTTTSPVATTSLITATATITTSQTVHTDTQTTTSLITATITRTTTPGTATATITTSQTVHTDTETTTSLITGTITRTTTPATTTSRTTAKPDEVKPWAGSTLTCKPGRKIGNPDRCNTCTCPASGRFADATVCSTKKSTSKVCRRRRAKRCVPGEQFTKADGCTSCMCPKIGFKARAKKCTNTCQSYDYYYARRLEMLV